jgi:cephalosporin hydroxylase
MANPVFAGMKHRAKTLHGMISRGIYRAAVSTKTDQEIVDRFHLHYYDSGPVFGGTWTNTKWLGVPILKCPLDLWIYQEMIYELKPDWIIECGTAAGGSALYLASLFDLVGKGKIVSIDIEARARPTHPRITYLTGSSTAPDIIDKVKALVRDSKQTIVLLDSDHSKKHVLDELRTYYALVTPGSYMVVEDTNVNGHPVQPDFGPGPMEALEEFLRENKNFVIDKTKEKLLLTFNPKGYLKRIP